MSRERKNFERWVYLSSIDGGKIPTDDELFRRADMLRVNDYSGQEEKKDKK